MHLEGTVPPELIRRLAERNGMPVPDGVFDGPQRFAYTDFLDFLRTYDLAASVIRTGDDYRDVTYEYLVFLFRTPAGLRLRSVGEKPRAADSVGIRVQRTRYLAVVASGCLAGLGGVYLSVALVGSFNQGMTAGRGFIALAVVIFGAWRPYAALAGACLFGFSSAIAQRLPAFSESLAVLFQALPYLLVLIVVAGLIGRSRPPAAIGVPYVKE